MNPILKNMKALRYSYSEGAVPIMKTGIKRKIIVAVKKINPISTAIEPNLSLTILHSY